MVFPAEKGFERSPGCAADDNLLKTDHLVVQRFTARRCPQLHLLEGLLDNLWAGRTGLIELQNRANVILAEAPDGVPGGDWFRQVPLPGRWRVPAISTLPTAAACASPGGTSGLVTARIEPDTPVPRCVKVRPSQGRRIVNGSGDYGRRPRTITVRFVGFTRRVAPGGAAVFRPRRNLPPPGRPRGDGHLRIRRTGGHVRSGWRLRLRR